MKYLMQIFGSGEDYANNIHGSGGTEVIFENLDQLKTCMDILMENGAVVVTSEYYGGD